jgi:hypothetical protein
VGLTYDDLKEALRRVEALIARLHATDGFVEDIVYLEQQRKIVASARAAWRSERDGNIVALRRLRRTAADCEARLSRWTTPSLARLAMAEAAVPSADPAAAGDSRPRPIAPASGTWRTR